MSSKGRPYRELEIEGFTVLVGRGDRENDELSLRVAEPDDFWMHVAGPPGSHVVIRNPERLAELPKPVLRAAAVIMWSPRWTAMVPKACKVWRLDPPRWPQRAAQAAAAWWGVSLVPQLAHSR